MLGVGEIEREAVVTLSLSWVEERVRYRVKRRERELELKQRVCKAVDSNFEK